MHGIRRKKEVPDEKMYPRSDNPPLTLSRTEFPCI